MGEKKQNIFWSQEEYDLVRENYTKSDGFSILAKKMPNRTYNQIKAQAYKMGLRRKPQYFKDDDFFIKEDSMVAAVAGFIAADGYVDPTNRRLHINVSEKDKDYLEEIRKSLSYTGPLYSHQPKLKTIKDRGTGKEYHIGKNRVYTLLISKIDQWLIDLKNKWNIHTCKTHDLKPPLTNDLKTALCYISGLIDGDGWIVVTKEGAKSISVMGTKEVMQWVKNIFDFIVPATGRGSDLQADSSDNIYTYTVTGARCYILWKIFMSLDILRMSRKWDKFREWDQQISSGNFEHKRTRTTFAKYLPYLSVIEELKTKSIKI